MTAWDRYLSVRRSATAATAAALDQHVVEQTGLISTASPAGGDSGGSVFVHADPGAETFAAFLDTVAPSYIEVADGTESAAEAVESAGFELGHDLVIMAVRADHLRSEPAPSGITIDRAELDDPDVLAAVADLLASVEEIPTIPALQYCRDLGRLADLHLFAATTPDGRVVGTAGVRKFDASGIVMLVQTHPSWRGRGIAGSLVTQAIELTEVESAFLVATSAGCSVYRRIGFVNLRSMTEWVPMPG